MIEKYKNLCDNLEKQEKKYMKKIIEEKKIMKNRSESVGMVNNLNKNNKMYRIKSNYHNRNKNMLFDSYIYDGGFKISKNKKNQTLNTNKQNGSSTLIN